MDEKLLTFIPKLYFPRELYLGPKSMTFFKTIADKKKLYIVSHAFRKNNAWLGEELLKDGTVVEHTGEPLTSDVEALRDRCTKEGIEYLVVCGGGSVIDLAKIVKRDCNIQLVAVPTTIGSGSEVSQYSLVTDPATKKKTVVTSSQLLPEVIIIDPRFFETLTKEQVVYQSLDAFAHAIESLVSRLANPMSDAYALMAIEHLYRHLQEMTDGRDDASLRQSLKEAATFAGIAQSSAATGLIHSFAHVLGSKYEIPHAEAVSMFLVDVLTLNVTHTDKYQKLNTLKELSDSTIIPKLTALIGSFSMNRAKLPLVEDSIPETAELIRKDVCTMSNPYAPTSDDIVAILRRHV